MSILSRNRKPISDDVVHIDGIPYRRLSESKRDDGFGCPIYEAVDPWGNQVMVGETVRGPEVMGFPYLKKGAFEVLRVFHPEMREVLDTDFGDRGADSVPGTYIKDRRLGYGYGSPHWFVRTFTISASGGMVSSWSEVEVMTPDDARWRMKASASSGTLEEFHEKGETWYRVRRYSRSDRVWRIEDFIPSKLVDDMEALESERLDARAELEVCRSMSKSKSRTGQGSGKSVQRRAAATPNVRGRGRR